MSDLVADDLACWNETNTFARRALIQRYWSQSCTYVDPMVDAAGHDDLDATIGAVLADADGRIERVLGFLDRVPQ